MSVINVTCLCLDAEASFLRHSAEDMIPEWGGYAIGSIRLLIVMQGMMYPKHFHKMHVIYEFTGKDLPMDKLQKAVSLSEEKYCGVSAVYRKAIELTSEIKVIEG